MLITGAWAIKQLPEQYVLEIPAVGLRCVRIVPFRELTGDDLTPYEGYHPRKINGIPMPDYLYHFYGLEKSGEVASEVVHVRLTPTDKAEIASRAKEAGVSVTEYIKRVALQ